jgi:hypothetical protein
MMQPAARSLCTVPQMPDEIACLDLEINELQAKRTRLYREWLNSISPFKVGDRVTWERGRGKAVGQIQHITLSYDHFSYTVAREMVKGGFEICKIYSWDVQSMQHVDDRSISVSHA